MQHLPTDWSALCALVFLLGMERGFGADHLATVDGMTRYNALHRRAFARYCGLLFSLGHGVVVLGVAIVVAIAHRSWLAPPWLQLFGACVSIVFLILIGLINLHAVLATGSHQMLRPVGIKGRLFSSATQASRPLAAAAVGSVFAISFDTISQSALFAVTAIQFGGTGAAIVLALLFCGGMIAMDALNGLWVARLIARADQIAVIASRVMSTAVAGVSLLVAAIGIARLAAPVATAWGRIPDIGVGLTVCAAIGSGYWYACWLARRARRHSMAGASPSACRNGSGATLDVAVEPSRE